MAGVNGRMHKLPSAWEKFEGKLLRDGEWVEREKRDRPIASICMAHGQMIEAPTTWSLVGMGIVTRRADIMISARKGADPAHGRNEAVKLSIELGADYMVLCDQDMQFPPDALDRLIAHDVDVVGVDYRGREFPFTRIGVPAPDAAEETTGLVPYMMWGLGFVVVKRRVFFQIPRPWFARDYDTVGYVTEDFWFCDRVRKAGLTVWCDLDLSRECYHVGHQPVPWDIPEPAKQQMAQAAE
jgi:hypothetical protein